MTKVNGRRSRRHICNKHNTRTHARTYLHAWSGVQWRTFFPSPYRGVGVCAPDDKTKLVPLRSQRWRGERRQPDHFSRLYDRVPSRARIQ